MLIYISTSNAELAKKAAMWAIEEKHSPIVPQLECPGICSQEAKRGVATRLGLMHLDDCDELWVFLDEGLTLGMKTEIERAELKEIPIRYFKQNTVADAMS